MSNKLYVGNFPYSTTVQDLKDLFGDFGEVADATIIMDRMSGRSKGFGFVEFTDEGAANAAIEALDGKDFNGRDLKVNVARPKAE